MSKKLFSTLAITAYAFITNPAEAQEANCVTVCAKTPIQVDSNKRFLSALDNQDRMLATDTPKKIMQFNKELQDAAIQVYNSWNECLQKTCPEQLK
jgi:hypothetical protein